MWEGSAEVSECSVGKKGKEVEGMGSVKVYGPTMSTAVSRVLACLFEKEVPFDLIPVNMAKGEHKKPDYLKLQVVTFFFFFLHSYVFIYCHMPVIFSRYYYCFSLLVSCSHSAKFLPLKTSKSAFSVITLAFELVGG